LTSGGTTSIAWDPGAVDGGPNLEIDMTGITQFAGSTTSKFESQNGNSAGELSGYSINPEGVLELNFTNGEQKELFQLAVGNVNNPNGLEQQGENFYTTTGASGDLQLGRAGRDLRTAVVAGTLEASNVDLATEFSEMIVAQRGYQAAARVVTTSDEVLQETVQLKR
jgi:flagellar hook protein FlgE